VKKFLLILAAVYVEAYLVSNVAGVRNLVIPA